MSAIIELIKLSLISYMFVALGRDGFIFSSYRRLLHRFPEWLANPLGGCFMCFTGQVCLWYYIFTKPFNIIELLFYPSAGIMLSLVWDRLFHFLYDEI